MASNKSSLTTVPAPAASGGNASDEYVTPTAYELEKMLSRGGGVAEYTHISEVWPRVYIGDKQTARDKSLLAQLGVTHVLNAAEGTWNNVATGAGYYQDMVVVGAGAGAGVAYLGLVAEDVVAFDLSQHFYPAAEFIDATLCHPQNTLLVHCVMGRSRSASLFLAYLMIYQHMTLADAVDHVKHRRLIRPNWGFLKQLRHLDESLQEARRNSSPSDREEGERSDG